MKITKIIIIVLSMLTFLSGQIIVNHNSTNLSLVPTNWIDSAKVKLHIAYGHTSHGSQITTGMSGLIGFTGGCGGPQFAWNNGGTDGALDLHDYAMDGDCGYYPQWFNNTVSYLDNPANQDVNVIIWSWCGQISGYTSQKLINNYINPMIQLETDYPNVKFVYMTGHLKYSQHENTNARNQQLRDFCVANNKILFDFADIESYNPDGTYFEFANDNCDYYSDWNNSNQGNWATEWQDTHTENVDWYSCYSAHSQPLNANQKAYAAWHLWARLSGWAGTSKIENNFTRNPVLQSKNYPNPFNPTTIINFSTEKQMKIKLSIFTAKGEFVKTLTNQIYGKGSHFINFDASTLTSGIYYYTIESDEGRLTKKMMLLK